MNDIDTSIQVIKKFNRIIQLSETNQEYMELVWTCMGGTSKSRGPSISTYTDSFRLFYGDDSMEFNPIRNSVVLLINGFTKYKSSIVDFYSLMDDLKNEGEVYCTLSYGRAVPHIQNILIKCSKILINFDFNFLKGV